MVEEMMLLANVTVAEVTLRGFSSCALLRRHPAPAPRQFEPLLQVAAATGTAIDTSSSKVSCRTVLWMWAMLIVQCVCACACAFALLLQAIWCLALLQFSHLYLHWLVIRRVMLSQTSIQPLLMMVVLQVPVCAGELEQCLRIAINLKS